MGFGLGCIVLNVYGGLGLINIIGGANREFHLLYYSMVYWS